MSSVTQRAAEVAFRHAAPVIGRAYRAASPSLRRVSERFAVSDYDDVAVAFRGGELADLVHRNYEKSLHLLWKAELVAPWLGFADASELERASAGESSPSRELLPSATLEEVRAEFQRELGPEQREAVCRIMDLIVHGEAYALYTSATLLPLVEGTGAKVGLATQVLEEAKHFLVLRALMQSLGDVRPLPDTARIVLETIARQRGYAKMFGMNVVVESLATSLFSELADVPGLRHVLPFFHADEARHCGFARSYAAAGKIPARITHSRLRQANRTRIVLMALPFVWDTKPYFDALGLDAFAFFGRFVGKAGRLAEASGLPVLGGHKELAAQLNVLFNAWRKEFEPSRHHGFVDYTAPQTEGAGLRAELRRREAAVFA